MGFPRGRGGFRGGGRGGGGRGGGRGRGRGGGGYGGYDAGPPDTVTEIGHYEHPCESDLVVKCTNENVPYFNAPIYLENKSQIGKVDEIFGPINEFYFSVKLSQNMNASSFEKTQKFFIDPAKLLPLSRFLPKPAGARGVGKRGGGRGGRGGGRGGTPRGRGGRGGFGSPRGGRGFSRGGSGGRGFRGGGGRGRY